MNQKRIKEISGIVKRVLLRSEGDSDFSHRIASRTDLNEQEKVFAGCLTRKYLRDLFKNQENTSIFIVQNIDNGYIVSEAIVSADDWETDRTTYFETMEEIILNISKKVSEKTK